ncbi:protein kinase [Streptomyces sp. NPDC089799]|uniref:serine/threonine-protein kinase n=1 Tax=Streptomyces sp. NPDC089799 TaxID=3155066 RepID=UPI003441918C
MTVHPGRVLNGRYRLDAHLGHGAQGAVWLGHDLALDCRVAVKVALLARGHGGRSEELERAVERFGKEARAMARVRKRPHVAVIHDYGEDGDTLYHVMDHIEGTPLSAHTGRGRQLTLEQTVRWTRHICAGLAEVHAVGVVHRDIKPGNVVIDTAGSAHVVDFGLALLPGASLSQGPPMGTPHYTAPERFDGRQADERSDLYSLGCVVYEMLTGWSPFGHIRDLLPLMTHHASVLPEPPRTVRPGIPAALDRLVMNLLAKVPAERPPDATAVARAIREIAHAPDRPADPHVDARHVDEIRDLERFIQHHVHGPRAADPEVLDARARHARLTGESGDPRGAASLYQRLGQDCVRLLGPEEDRAFDAYREASRWQARVG